MQPFLFDRDFDDEIEAEVQAGIVARNAPNRPVITPADLANARVEAHAEGRAQGMAEGKAEAEMRLSASLESEVASTLAALLPEIHALRDARAAHHKALEMDLMRLVRALSESLLPEIIEAYAAKRIEAFCRKSLRMAEGSGGLEIKLPPALIPAITTALGDALTAGHAPIRLSPAPELAAGEARAFWDQGRASHSETALHQSLITTIRALSAPSKEQTHE